MYVYFIIGGRRKCFENVERENNMSARITSTTHLVPVQATAIDPVLTINYNVLAQNYG